jgi:hypothetical protein
MDNFYSRKEVKKYVVKTENPNYDLHHFDTPFRSLVVAPSGSEKSNFITNFKGKGTFDNVYIFCKSRDEPLYQFLGDKSKGLIEIHENLDKLPALIELKPSEQTLLIFDDFITDIKKFPIISEYFISGRKRGCSLMCLSQSYYGTPKIIRQNVNFCVILKLGGSRDINSIMRECSVGINKEDLLSIYKEATKDKFDCLKINLDKNGNERYKKNFLEYFEVE